VSPLLIAAGGAGAGAGAAAAAGTPVPRRFPRPGPHYRRPRAGTATPAAMMRAARQSRTAEVLRRCPIIFLVLPDAAVSGGIVSLSRVAVCRLYGKLMSTWSVAVFSPARSLLFVDVVAEDHAYVLREGHETPKLVAPYAFFPP